MSVLWNRACFEFSDLCLCLKSSFIFSVVDFMLTRFILFHNLHSIRLLLLVYYYYYCFTACVFTAMQCSPCGFL